MNKFNAYITLALLILAGGSPRVSFAQATYNIKEMTPPIEAALQNRRDRYDQLKGFKKSQTVGENNKGYVELLKEDEIAEVLVSAENADRKVIYQAIADQNDLKGAIGTIEEVFAQVQQDKAEPGDKVQLPNGEWVQK